MINGIFEILSNKEWMIQQEFLHSILPTLQYNITNHASLGIERDKKSPMAIGQQGQDFLREYQVTEDGNVLPVASWEDGDVLGKMKEPFVNVMPVDGPITRNGGACSYGSRDIRDWMMRAADNKYCRGHVLHINTPGGSAWAKNDFQQGIEYAHARGHRVIAFIDGLCASAGMYLASLCDEVYVMNPKDQLGCVGVMAAFCTMKSGDKFMSGETYREYYATKSINKNKEMRDIAENDDAKLLIEELDRLEAEFRADMKAAFPEATDDHLDGKVFDAADVMGILCDGQMMLGDVISRVFALYEGTEKPIERTADRKIVKRQSAMNEPMQQALTNAERTSQQIDNILSNTNNTINMKEKFPAVFALLGVEEMQMQDGGAFMNEGLLATLNAAIEAKNQELANAKALADSLTQEKENLTQQVNDLTSQVETLNNSHTSALEEKDNMIATLEQEKADLQTKVDENATAMENLQTELNGSKESLTTAQNTLAERDQQINDLNATIEDMKQDAGEGAQGGSPANNGQGADGLHQASAAPQWDPTLSATENKQRMEAYEAELKKQVR